MTAKLLVAITAALSFAVPQPPPRPTPSARENSRKNMPILTSKIETFIPDPSAVMVRAKVLGSRFKPSGAGMETGVVTFKTLDLYRGHAPAPGEIFEIEGVRDADAERRPLDRVNQWNALPFGMNHELVLALHAGPNPKLWIALAVTQSGVQGADLKEAVAIELLGAGQRLARLQLALRSESYLLQSYAINALREPGVATRDQGALALSQAFEASQSPSVRASLFAAMETPPYPNMSLGPDHANRAILSAWLKAILHESNADRKAEYLDSFAAQLGSKLTEDSGKDQTLRVKFASSIQDPPKAQVAVMLREASAAKPDDARLKRVAEAWSH